VVELHEMTMGQGDVMQMRPLADGIEVPPHSLVTLQPGGLHIMMIDLQQALEPGDTVDFTLTFARQGDITVTLPVVDPDAMDMMMMATEEPAMTGMMEMTPAPSLVVPEGCAGVHFVGTWARPAVPGMPNSAAYGLVLNLNETPDRIISGTTAAAEALELHEMVMAEGDVMQMRPLADGIPLPAGGFALLKPGGLHIMLIGLTGPLTDGDTLNVTLELEQGGSVELAIPVREPEETPAPMAGMHG
jgi:copper(I)-binding protein